MQNEDGGQRRARVSGDLFKYLDLNRQRSGQICCLCHNDNEQTFNVQRPAWQSC